MRTLLGCLAAALVSGSVARADEMDRDTKGKAPAAVANVTTTGGSELDRESPDQSHYWRGGYGRGWGGGYYGRGWGGGYYGGGWGGGYGVSYYRGGWGGGWGGSYYHPYYGGWGFGVSYYRPVYASYYRGYW
jgi:hypothetical protein